MQRFLLICLAILALSSCRQKHFYSEYKTVNVKGWSSTDTLRFATDITDSNAIYNVFISIRHQKNYEFSNLWLNVTVGFGNQTRTTRFEIPLYKNDGKPFGKNSGTLCTQTISFQKNITFNKRGKYTVTIVQLMRKDPLDGISDAGIIMNKLPAH